MNIFSKEYTIQAKMDLLIISEYIMRNKISYGYKQDAYIHARFENVMIELFGDDEYILDYIEELRPQKPKSWLARLFT